MKMHGLGNDFVIFDARTETLDIVADHVRAIANRKTGVGCDQLIVVEPPHDDRADVFMRIFNADGGEVAACGNATRCVAAHIMAENNSEKITIETGAGLLRATTADNGMVAVDMGVPGFEWQDIPLSNASDTLHLGIEAGPLKDPVAVNVGNPHVVFFVDDVDAVGLETVGPEIEKNDIFPQGVNVGVAMIMPDGVIRLRVWERGAGITGACGTGACAALVAASRRGLAGRGGDVRLDGGNLSIEWRDDDHIIMTGPVGYSFAGVIYTSLLDRP